MKTPSNFCTGQRPLYGISELFHGYKGELCWQFDVGNLDAPEIMPGGSTKRSMSIFDSFPSIALRDDEL